MKKTSKEKRQKVLSLSQVIPKKSQLTTEPNVKEFAGIFHHEKEQLSDKSGS